jgi:acyl-CoA hydrolase
MHDIYYGTQLPPHRQPIPLVHPNDRIGEAYLRVDPAKVVAVVANGVTAVAVANGVIAKAVVASIAAVVVSSAGAAVVTGTTTAVAVVAVTTTIAATTAAVVTKLLPLIR